MCQRMRLPKLPDLAFFCLSFAAFNLLPVNGRLSSHPNSTAASRCAGKSSPFSDASSSPGSTSDSSTWECCMLHKCLYFRPDPTAGAVCTLRFERVNQSLLLSVGLMPVAAVAQPEQLSAACVTVRALGFGPIKHAKTPHESYAAKLYAHILCEVSQDVPKRQQNGPLHVHAVVSLDISFARGISQPAGQTCFVAVQQTRLTILTSAQSSRFSR